MSTGISQEITSKGNEGEAAELTILRRERAELKAALDRVLRFDETVLGNMGEGLYTTDENGLLVTMNPAAEAILGWRVSELRGKSVHDVIHHSHRDGTAIPAEKCQAYNVLSTGRAVVDVDDEFIRKDGTYFDVRYTSSPLMEAGRVMGLVVVFRDDSERRTLQREQEFQLNLAEKIRVAASPAELLAEIAEMVGRHLDVHRCLFNEIDLAADLETVHSDFARDGASVAGVHRISEYSQPMGEIMKAGKTVVNRDSERDPRTAELFDKVYGPSRELSYVAVPMLRGGEWVASLWCSHDRPRDWTDREVALLENIAERTWSAVERLRALEKISESEERYRGIVDQSVAGFAETDLSGRFTTVNGRFCEITGYSREELLDLTLFEITYPEDIVENKVKLDALLTRGTPFQIEKRYIRKDGSLVWVNNSVSVIRDRNGVPKCLVAAVIDIDVRKSAEKTLRESEARFRNMADHAPVMIWITEPDGRCTFLSQSWYEFTGQTEETGLGYGWLEATHPDDRANAEEVFLRANANREAFLIEYRLRSVSGEYRWAIDSAHPRFGENGEFLGYIGSVIDITTRKQAEDKLRASEERLQLAQSAGKVGVWDWDILAGRTYWSETMWSFYGEVPSSVNPDDEFWSAHLHPDDRARVKEHLDRTISSSDSQYHDEFRIIGAEGRTIWIDSMANLVRSPDGEAIRAYGVNLDITQRKEAEQKIARDRETFIDLVENAPFGLYIVDSDLRITTMNKGSQTGAFLNVRPIIGRRLDEAIRVLWPEPAASDVISRFRHTLETGEAYRSAEFVHEREDIGRVEAYEWELHRIVLPDGNHGVVCYYYDSTGLRNAEQAVRESEEKSRTLFESIDEGFVIVEMIFDEARKPIDYRFVEANPAFTRLTGLPKDALGKTARELVPDLEAFWFETYGSVALTGESVRFENWSEPMGRWFDVYASRVGPEPSHRIAIVFNNITERKQAETALRESEERFSKAFKASPLVLTISSLETGRLLEVNDTFVAVTGYPRSEAIGKTTLDLGVWAKPADREAEMDLVRRNGQLSATEYIFRTRDGREIIGLLSAERIEIGGEPCALTVIQDITERRKAVEDLRKSEIQLRLVTDSLPALIAYVDNETRYRFVNKTYSEWFGKPAEELIGKPVKSIVGSEAYGPILPLIEKALAGETVSVHAELAYEGAGPRSVHIVYVPDIGDDGLVRGFFSLVSDMTELRRSEDLLRSTEDRIALLMENVTDYAIFSVDTDGVIETWNNGAERIFGYRAEEIIGRTSDVLFTPEDIARGVNVNEMRSARQKGRSSDETWYVKKDGSRFFANMVMMPLIVGKRLTGYAKIVSDLTERKRRAEELQSAHDELELRVFQRTKELGETNELLRQEIRHRKQSEKQRVNLLHRIVSAQEAERKRIARDIHDQLGQRLTALRLKLASLRDLCAGGDLITARVERLQEIAALLDSEVSFLASELRPSVLDDLGLEEALRAYAGEWAGHFDIRLSFHSNGLLGKRYGKEAETQIYRIAQEALNNVAKHSNAAEVTVMAEQTSEFLVLIVEDSGSGFAVDSGSMQSGKGLGLIGMRERAALIGAELEIESGPGKGTTVFLRLPNRKKG